MKLRHIEVFHAVMLTGTVNGAARLLNVTQPAVTKILQHAEDQLGFKLFIRNKGRIMIAISYNSDVGDAWEFADDAWYPEKFSDLAIRLGVNYIVYGLTH